MIYLKYDFSNTKEIRSTYDVLKKIIEIIQPYRQKSSQMYFYIEDFNPQKGSNLFRLKTNYPQLEKYYKSKSDEETYIGNIPGDWRNQIDKINISEQEIIDITKGIPRRYSFYNSTFMIDKIKIFKKSPITKIKPYIKNNSVNEIQFAPRPSSYGMTDYYYPSISLFSDSFPSCRSIWFSIKIYISEIEYDQVRDKVDEIDLIKEFKNNFRFLRKKIEIVRSNENKYSEKIYSYISDKKDTILTNLYRLESNMDLVGNNIKFKELFTTEFKGRKYRIRARKQTFGEYEIYKKTKNNNYLYVEVLLSPNLNYLDIGIKFISYNCESKIELPLFTDTTNKNLRPQLFISNSSETMEVFNKNLEVIEDNLLEGLDEICGASPDWFKI